MWVSVKGSEVEYNFGMYCGCVYSLGQRPRTSTSALYSRVKVIHCKTMPHKKRKISDLTADANALLQTLNEFQDSLDNDDEDLPSSLFSALEEFRSKLESIKVCITRMFQLWGLI